MAPALLRPRCASVISQNAAHQPPCDPEEMGAIHPFDLRIAKQPQVNFMHQGGRLQCVVRTFMPQVVSGQTAKLLVNHVESLVRGGFITLSRLNEQCRKIGGLGVRHSSPPDVMTFVAVFYFHFWAWRLR